MTSPYIGEIRLFAGSYAPEGWFFCDGKILNISEYDTLYTLLGSTYGGDGQMTFGLPDLQGRVPLHTGVGPGGNSYPMGAVGGSESVTLSQLQMGVHKHVLSSTGQSATTAVPTPGTTLADQVGGDDKNVFAYAPSGASASLYAGSLTVAGGSVAHENMQPFVTVNYIIAWSGMYPSPP